MFRHILRLLSVMAAIVAGLSDDVTPHREVFPGIGEYYYVGIPVNWDRAQVNCLADDGHLAVIDSAAEAAVIRGMLANHEATFIHLGFQFIEGEYITVTGKPVEGTTEHGDEWAVGSPNGGTDNNCGAFSAAGLNDIRCASYLVYICEIPTARG